ncbi:MAG: hypothetical protein QM796_12300 [Chthoniobacteraceae bacterium]
MPELIEKIQEADVTWIPSQKEPGIFDAIFAGRHVQLRMNDFPDEIAYTLIVGGEEFEFEDTPPGWFLKGVDSAD